MHSSSINVSKREKNTFSCLTAFFRLFLLRRALQPRSSPWPMRPSRPVHEDEEDGEDIRDNDEDEDGEDGEDGEVIQD